MKKTERELSFEKKRNFSIVTPCCNKTNKDGKFVNFKNYPVQFGYCHSCGESKTPPVVYINDVGQKYIWNENESCFQKYINDNYNMPLESITSCSIKPKKEIQFIHQDYINRNYTLNFTDNFIRFLFQNYDKKLVEKAISKYQIKSAKNGGTVFLSINKNRKIQKVKVSYYNKMGKRSNKFNVPFKNDDGYYSCLFGEHLLNNSKKINLVESEKTALVCSIIFPNYNWLAYGGINGLTDSKLQILTKKKVLIIPDISNNAVKIIKDKRQKFINLGIEAIIWDMTEGKSDIQLKEEEIYNSDLEDLLKAIL